jgi:predicted nucleic acid-binding protein
MTIVVDSNIFIALTLIDEPFHTQATQMLSVWLSTNTLLVAPHLFKSEITAVLRKAVYQERITHYQGDGFLNYILGYPVTFYEDVALLKHSYELAYQLNRPRAYDTQYLALSERLACDFWTADERFYNAVKDKFPRVKWLGNWKTS